MGLRLRKFFAPMREQEGDQFLVLVLLRDLKGGLSMALDVRIDALFKQGLRRDQMASPYGPMQR